LRSEPISRARTTNAEDVLSKRGVKTTVEQTKDVDNPARRTSTNQLYSLGNLASECGISATDYQIHVTPWQQALGAI
jgi:hypothetical protein